jgi:hypothetical protein
LATLWCLVSPLLMTLLLLKVFWRGPAGTGHRRSPAGLPRLHRPHQCVLPLAATAGTAGVRALLLYFACGMAMAQGSDIGAVDWSFAVTLDGKPIGTHRFVVGERRRRARSTSQARLVVRLLGVPVYRYTHIAQERWQGDCLRELHSQDE